MSPDAHTHLESDEPVRGYGVLRVVIVLTGLVAAGLLDFEHSGRLGLLLAVVFLPLSVAVLVAAQRLPGAALNQVAAIVDLVSLAAIVLLVPGSYAAVDLCAVVLALTYPLVGGAARGVIFAAVTVAVLLPATVLADPPVEDSRLAFYQAVFAVVVIAGAAFTGRLGEAESNAHIRARELTRRTMEAGNKARRDVAESLHDGPLQELVAADMKLTGALNASARGDVERTRELIDAAREVVERNIGAIRDELVGLGPMAFEELTFQEAVEQCAPAWGRRYELDVGMDLEPLDMPDEVCGALFSIAQEAVANAGRHAHAARVDLTLRGQGGRVELCVSDDGTGFGDVSPLGPREPGHVGLASMRERAAIVSGTLAIESSDDGTRVRVTLPGPA